MTFATAEFNTLITALGMACATVQGTTGFYAANWKKRTSLLRSNEILFRAHRAFGSFATCLYGLGLVAGSVGLVGALLWNEPPLELESASFNVHTWGSFPVLIVILWKTWLSYFRKQPLHGKGKWIGVAAVLAWAFTWLSAAVSYYVRTQPDNLQHPPPIILLPLEWLGLQLALPFLAGGAVALAVLRAARRWEAARAS